MWLFNNKHKKFSSKPVGYVDLKAERLERELLEKERLEKNLFLKLSNSIKLKLEKHKEQINEEFKQNERILTNFLHKISMRKIAISLMILLSLASKPTFSNTTKIVNKIKKELDWIKKHDEELKNNTIDFNEVRRKMLGLFDELDKEVEDDITKERFDEAKKNLEYLLKIATAFQEEYTINKIKKLQDLVHDAEFNKKLIKKYDEIRHELKNLVNKNEFEQAKKLINNFIKLVTETTNDEDILNLCYNLKDDINKEESNHFFGIILDHTNNLLKNHQEWEAVKYLRKELSKAEEIKNRDLSKLIVEEIKNLEHNALKGFVKLKDGIYNVHGELFVILTSSLDPTRTMEVQEISKHKLLTKLAIIRNVHIINETMGYGEITTIYETKEGYKYLIQYKLNFPSKTELLNNAIKRNGF